jgi:hypothetical protein
MRRLLLLSVLLLAFCPHASATPVQVSGLQVSGWQFGASPAYLRIYSSGFTASDGTVVPAGSTSAGPYQQVTCSVASSVVTCPTFTIQTTTDSMSDQTATYTGVLFDSANRQRVVVFSGFSVPTSLPSPISYADLANHNLAVTPVRDTTTYTKTQVDAKVAEAATNGNPATTTTLGRVKVSATPADASSPVAVETTDPRMSALGVDASSWASLCAAVTAIGSTRQVLDITTALPSGSSCAVPSTLTLHPLKGGSIVLGSGHTVTILSGARLWPGDAQIFSGSGAVSFSGNTAVPELLALWWGVSPDATTGFDGATTSGSPTVGSAGAAFTSSLVGKSVTVINPSGTNFHSTVSAVPDATHLTLAGNVTFTGSTLRYSVGTENGAPLAKALAAAGTGHVTRVRVGRGNYLFLTAPGDVPQGVNLEGEWNDKWSNHIGGFPNTQNTCTTDLITGIPYVPTPVNNYLSGDATTFVVDAGEGSATGYFLKAGNHSAVKGLHFWYPGQLSQLAAPKVYPWAIDLNGYWSEASYIELGLAYQGIYAHDGDVVSVHHITGQSISVGIYATKLYNHPKFSDIHIVPTLGYYADCATQTSLSPLALWITAHGTGMKFGRVDAGELGSFEVWGYNTGLLFANESNGPWMTVHDGVIESIHPVIVENAQPAVLGQGAGLNIRKVDMGSYSLLWPGGMPPGNTPTGVLIYPTFVGNLRLEDSEIAVLGDAGAGYAVWYQEGATGNLWLTNNLIMGDTNAKPLVLQGPASGSGVGTAFVSGNRFNVVNYVGGKNVYLSGRMKALFGMNVYNTPYVNTFDTSGPPALVTSNSPVALASQSCNDFFTDNASVCGLVSAGGLSVGQIVFDFNTKKLKLPGLSFSDLGTPVNNQSAFCVDCTETSDPCTGGGTGAYARGLNGRWVCSK